jgi:hypothetical protein
MDMTQSIMILESLNLSLEQPIIMIFYDILYLTFL